MLSEGEGEGEGEGGGERSDESKRLKRERDLK